LVSELAAAGAPIREQLAGIGRSDQIEGIDVTNRAPDGNRAGGGAEFVDDFSDEFSGAGTKAAAVCFALCAV
jgi:hypothetical protein